MGQYLSMLFLQQNWIDVLATLHQYYLDQFCHTICTSNYQGQGEWMTGANYNKLMFILGQNRGTMPPWWYDMAELCSLNNPFLLSSITLWINWQILLYQNNIQLREACAEPFRIINDPYYRVRTGVRTSNLNADRLGH